MQPVLPAFLIARWLLVLVVLAGLYFLSGFLVPVLAALIICLASWRPYQRLLSRCGGRNALAATLRSEEHTSELQSLMRISYAVFCLKKKNRDYNNNHN